MLLHRVLLQSKENHHHRHHLLWHISLVACTPGELARRHGSPSLPLFLSVRDDSSPSEWARRRLGIAVEGSHIKPHLISAPVSRAVMQVPAPAQPQLRRHVSAACSRRVCMLKRRRRRDKSRVLIAGCLLSESCISRMREWSSSDSSTPGRRFRYLIWCTGTGSRR